MLGRSMMKEMLGHDPFEDFFRQDPFFGAPFGGMGRMHGGGNQLRLTDGTTRGMGGGDSNSLTPFGGGMMIPFGDMGGGFGGMGMMSGGGGGMMMMSSQSFSSDGNTVHSSTTQARMGPGGVAEIQRKVKDGRTGQEQMILERRIGERARRVEKSRNLQTGDEETVDNSYGIEDGLEEHFDKEFEQIAGRGFTYNPPQVNYIQQSSPARVVQQPRVDYRAVPSSSNSQQRVYVQQQQPQKRAYVQQQQPHVQQGRSQNVQYVQTAPRSYRQY